MTDVLELVIIELPKYMKYAKKEKRENLNLWLEFFKNPEVIIMANENDSKEIKETKQAIKNAQENLEKISQDEHEQYLAELREKYVRDQIAVQEYGYYKGIDEGKEQGELNSKKEIAKKLLTEGMDIETVARITELPIEEIKKIQENN